MENSFIINTLSGIIAGFISGLAVTWISRLFTKKNIQPQFNHSISHVRVEVTKIIKKEVVTGPNRNVVDTGNASNNGFELMIIVLGVLLYLTYSFLRYVDLVLMSFQFFISGIISFLMMTLVNQYLNKVIAGNGWKVMFIFISLLSTLGFYCLYLIKYPFVSEYSIQRWPQIANADSFEGFIKAGGWKTLWFTYQLLGVISLFGSLIIPIPSLIYYNAAVWTLKNPSNRFFRWLVSVSAGYNKIWIILVASFTLCIIAFLLISGLAFQWLNH